MRIGFYPGCSLNGTSREYNESVKAIGKALGIDWVELKDWNCCGATAAHSMNKELSLALPTRILALAEKQGFQEIVVRCADGGRFALSGNSKSLECPSIYRKIYIGYIAG